MGAFLPIVSLPIIGSYNYFRNGHGDGTIILVLAVLSVILAVTRRFGWLWITGLCTLAITLYDLVNAIMLLSDAQGKMDEQLAGNPFKGLADVAMNSVQLEWGWAVLIIGGVLIVVAAAIRDSPAALHQATEESSSSQARWIVATVILCLASLGLGVFLKNHSDSDIRNSSPSAIRTSPKQDSSEQQLSPAPSGANRDNTPAQQQANDAENRENRLITKLCGDSVDMQACVNKQLPGLSMVPLEDPIFDDRDKLFTARSKCTPLFPDNFDMQAYCIQQIYIGLQNSGKPEESPRSPRESTLPAVPNPVPNEPTASSQTAASGFGGAPPRAGENGYGIPVCLYCPQPGFSSEAIKAKHFDGVVVLEALITPDGRATNVHVIRAVGLGLDIKALEIIPTWRFKPALGPNGRAATVIARIECKFHLDSTVNGMPN
ncbi:MAG: energy transducer TonB [Candidatus Acidiferrales bacterium]